MRGIVTLLAGFIVISFFGAFKTQEPIQNSQPQNGPPSSKVDDPNIKNRIISGEQIYKNMQAQLPIENPQVRGLMTEVPTLGLFITNKMWNSLTKEQKVDYTWYAESLIPSVKSSPQKYVGIPESAPLYGFFLSKTRGLCSDCWEIITGDPVRNKDKVTMTIDKVVVQGDTPWQAYDPCCRGIKASEFRQ